MFSKQLGFFFLKCFCNVTFHVSHFNYVQLQNVLIDQVVFQEIHVTQENAPFKISRHIRLNAPTENNDLICRYRFSLLLHTDVFLFNQLAFVVKIFEREDGGGGARAALLLFTIIGTSIFFFTYIIAPTYLQQFRKKN